MREKQTSKPPQEALAPTGTASPSTVRRTEEDPSHFTHGVPFTYLGPLSLHNTPTGA